MNFLINEDIGYPRRLWDRRGHNLFFPRLGEPNTKIWRRCLDQKLPIITRNLAYVNFAVFSPTSYGVIFIPPTVQGSLLPLVHAIFDYWSDQTQAPVIDSQVVNATFSQPHGLDMRFFRVGESYYSEVGLLKTNQLTALNPKGDAYRCLWNYVGQISQRGAYELVLPPSSKKPVITKLRRRKSKGDLGLSKQVNESVQAILRQNGLLGPPSTKGPRTIG